MFAGLLSSKLVFLDAIGSDPTQPRKIPGVFGIDLASRFLIFSRREGLLALQCNTSALTKFEDERIRVAFFPVVKRMCGPAEVLE